jgi:hypothetical protein
MVLIPYRHLESCAVARMAVDRAVSSLGGTVRPSLPIVEGVAAAVPSRALDRLAALPWVRAVTPDAPGRLPGVDPVRGLTM